MKSRRSRKDSVKGVASKVRVRGVNWWQDFKYVKLVPQIMGCKRHFCTCSYLEYSLDSRTISECKVPSPPYKSGFEGTCKGIHNFWDRYKLSGKPCPLAFTRFLVLVLESCVRDLHPIFGPPTLAPIVVLANKQLTMPPQKKSKKNTPAEANQEDHHIAEDTGNSLTAEPS
jgi:hypothetical protein